MECNLFKFRNGPKTEQGVGEAAIVGSAKFQIKLPDDTSIYTAELETLKLAIDNIPGHTNIRQSAKVDELTKSATQKRTNDTI